MPKDKSPYQLVKGVIRQSHIKRGNRGVTRLDSKKGPRCRQARKRRKENYPKGRI